MTVDPHLACCGIHAVDALLERLGVRVEKALDPLDPDDFVRIVGRLARAIDGLSGPAEATAMRDAIETLDVDWRALSPMARERVLEAAREAIGVRMAPVLPEIGERFKITGPEVMRASRRGAVTRFGFRIAVDMETRDVAAERAVRRTTGLYIRDEFGRRRDELAAIARQIVAMGLEEGSGSEEIAERIAAALGNRVTRGPSYWNLIATTFANTARTYSLLGSFQDAGVQTYTFEAVLDEVTTDQCRFYHGTVFPMSGAVDIMRRVTESPDPEAIREINPWVRAGRDELGNRVLYIPRQGERVVIAQVDRSGVGSRDDRGSFSREASAARRMELGAPLPPLHGNCRSTIVPDM